MLLIARQGLNTVKGFDVQVAVEISKLTGLEFKTAPNKVIPLAGGGSWQIPYRIFSSKPWLLTMHLWKLMELLT